MGVGREFRLAYESIVTVWDPKRPKLGCIVLVTVVGLSRAGGIKMIEGMVAENGVWRCIKPRSS